LFEKEVELPLSELLGQRLRRQAPPVLGQLRDLRPKPPHVPRDGVRQAHAADFLLVRPSGGAGGLLIMMAHGRLGNLSGGRELPLGLLPKV